MLSNSTVHSSISTHQPALRPDTHTHTHTHTLTLTLTHTHPHPPVHTDNVTLHLDGVLYLRVEDPYKASYGVEEPAYAVSQLAQTTMRSEIGKLTLDTIFRERTSLNESIVEAINQAAHDWGIACLRYEISMLTSLSLSL